MKRLHVRIRAQANQDIKDIFDWIASESGHSQTAEKFIDRIYDACETLGEFPLKGRARGDLQHGVRTLPFERIAVITYRVLLDEVEVLNIFYGGRDWETIVADMSGDSPTKARPSSHFIFAFMDHAPICPSLGSS